MRLRDLDAHFIRYESRIETWTRVLGDPLTWKSGDPTEEVTGPREHMAYVDTLADAQGVFMRCPKCAGPDGTGHYRQVTFAGRGVTDEQGSHGRAGGPTRWNVSGSGLDDLTTTPSILLEGGCGWHGFITNGDAA